MKTSEKIFATFYFILFAIVITLASIKAVVYTKNHVYSTEAIVIATDGNEVYIETEDENVWCFEDSNWKVNDTLKVEFYDNETKEVTDDEIAQYKITGHLN